MASGGPSSDVQTDAEVEPAGGPSSLAHRPSDPSFGVGARQKHVQESDSFSSGYSSQSSQSSKSSSSLVYAQTARPLVPSTDREYLKFLNHMPEELQEDNCDILIINATNDEREARTFKRHLEKDIVFCIHERQMRPRVKLLDEIRYGSMDNLDLAFGKALYVFLLVTREFCQEPWTLLQGQACLTEAIQDKDKKWCVVPIHTCSKKSKSYKLPMMLNSLRPINYWSGDEDQFYVDGVRKLLESKIGLLLERDRLLHEARQEYFTKNRGKILQNYEFSRTVSCPNFNSSSSSSSLPMTDSAGPKHANSLTIVESACSGKENEALPEPSIELEVNPVPEAALATPNNAMRVNLRNSENSDASCVNNMSGPLSTDVDLAGASLSNVNIQSGSSQEQSRMQASANAGSDSRQNQTLSQNTHMGSSPLCAGTNNLQQQSRMPAPRSVCNDSGHSQMSQSRRARTTPPSHVSEGANSSQRQARVQGLHSPPNQNIDFSSITVDGPASVDDLSTSPKNFYPTTTPAHHHVAPQSGPPGATQMGAGPSGQMGTSGHTQNTGFGVSPNAVINHGGRLYTLTQSGQYVELPPPPYNSLQPNLSQSNPQQPNFHPLQSQPPFHPPPTVPYYVPMFPYHYPYMPAPPSIHNYFPPQSFPSTQPPFSHNTSTEANLPNSIGSQDPNSSQSNSHNFSVPPPQFTPFNPYQIYTHPTQGPFINQGAGGPFTNQGAGFPQFTSMNASTNAPSHQQRTGVTNVSQQQLHQPRLDSDETSVKTPSTQTETTEAPTSAGSGISDSRSGDGLTSGTGGKSEDDMSSKGTVVQHIHHHHHKRQITVTKATNVLIGHQSKFVNNTTSDLTDAEDEDQDEEIDDSNSDEDDESEQQAYKKPEFAVATSRQGDQMVTQITQNRSIPSTDGSASRASRQTTPPPSDMVASENDDTRSEQCEVISTGFPECLEPASSRQPVESTDHEDHADVDDKNQTYPKKWVD